MNKDTPIKEQIQAWVAEAEAGYDVAALKHGLDPDDVVDTAFWAQWIEPLEDDDWPHRELRLGLDTSVMCLILPIAVGLRP